MKIWLSVVFSLSIMAPAVRADEKGMEEAYKRMEFHALEGNFDLALPFAVRLLNYLDPPEDAVLGHDYSNLFFYDLGTILLNLERWAEAKYCFTRCIINNNADHYLQETFGPSFTRKEWFARNRLEDQLFFREFILHPDNKNAEHSGASNGLKPVRWP